MMNNGFEKLLRTQDGYYKGVWDLGDRPSRRHHRLGAAPPWLFLALVGGE